MKGSGNKCLAGGQKQRRGGSGVEGQGERGIKREGEKEGEGERGQTGCCGLLREERGREGGRDEAKKKRHIGKNKERNVTETERREVGAEDTQMGERFKV